MTDVRFARSGDVNVAYRIVGDGPVDLAYAQDWELPASRHCCERLAEFSRLILSDKRGYGMSDRVPGATTLEERMDDCRDPRVPHGTREAAHPDRVLVTVLLTDVVGSTELAASLGDRRWRDMLEQHHVTVRSKLARFDGH